MKKINYALGILMLGILTSCGGGSEGDQNSVTLTVESQLGELGNYLSITDSEIVVKLVDDKKDGKDVKSLVSSLAVRVNKSVASDHDFDLRAVVLDENHVEITTLPPFNIEYKTDFDFDKYCYDILSAGTIRAQMKKTTEATSWTTEDQETWDKIRTQGKYILFKPYWDDSKYISIGNSDSSSYSGSSNSDEEIGEGADDDNNNSYSSAGSSTDSDFDEFLTAYENYVNKYISIMQKAKNGDYSAIAEAATLMQDAEEYGEKLQKMSGSLTSAQLAKFQKLQQKLLSAAQ